MSQFFEIPQYVQIGQFGKVVGGQHQNLEVGNCVGKGGLDAVDSVAGEEEGLQSRGEREVGQRADIIICEVDCILRLYVYI